MHPFLKFALVLIALLILSPIFVVLYALWSLDQHYKDEQERIRQEYSNSRPITEVTSPTTTVPEPS